MASIKTPSGLVIEDLVVGSRTRRRGQAFIFSLGRGEVIIPPNATLLFEVELLAVR